MNYIEYKFSFVKYLDDDQMGLIISDLGDLGFESFVEEDLVLLGYIKSSDLVNQLFEIDEYLSENIKTFKSVEKKEIEQQNWNELWESNFSPTVINDKCVVRAPFHDKFDAEFELVIMPKMSFGTGHHETTRLMLCDIFEIDIEGKKGLDMGCGTGVLGILAAMRGAKYLDIIDIDPWAYDNAIENVEQNNVSDKITVKIGDAALLSGCKYEFILANINRNILLNDMHIYSDALELGGTIAISGFLKEDIAMLIKKAEECGLTFVMNNSFEKWQMIRFIKN